MVMSEGSRGCLINQTPVDRLVRAGILLLIQRILHLGSGLVGVVLVVTKRQNTPKTTFFTAVSRPFYNAQLLLKILRGGSSLASLSIASNNDAMAILYKIFWIWVVSRKTRWLVLV